MLNRHWVRVRREGVTLITNTGRLCDVDHQRHPPQAHRHGAFPGPRIAPLPRMTTNRHADEIFCPKCGAGASRQAAFCHQCGQELGITTPMPAVEHGAPQSEFELVRSALAADYDVKERIGRGGMAAVYRAYERSLMTAGPSMPFFWRSSLRRGSGQRWCGSNL